MTGPAGSGTYHLLAPIYSPSPHVPINDETMGPVTVDRWATEVSLRYNFLNGTVAIDSTGANGGAIISYSIQLASPSFDIESFQPIGTLQPVATADNIAEVVFTGIDEGIHSLGPILPTGLTTEEVSGLFDTLLFIGEPNHSVDALDVNISGFAMSLLVVPEPSTGLTFFHKRNAGQTALPRTPGRIKRKSRGLHGVRESARQDSTLKLTALLHHVNEDCLAEAFFNLKKQVAVGIVGLEK